MSDKKHTVTFTFPTADMRDDFCVYMSNGGGEYGILADGEGPWEHAKFDYSRCFPAWGWEPGEPKHIDVRTSVTKVVRPVGAVERLMRDVKMERLRARVKELEEVEGALLELVAARTMKEPDEHSERWVATQKAADIRAVKALTRTSDTEADGS